MIRPCMSHVFVIFCIFFSIDGPEETRANVISPFKLKQWSILKDKRAERAEQNLLSKEKHSSFSKSEESWEENAHPMREELVPEQSTLPKEDLRRKEVRVLKTDLTDAEKKLFVGHIPDIEDVGVFHPIPVPSDFEVKLHASSYDFSQCVTLLEWQFQNIYGHTRVYSIVTIHRRLGLSVCPLVCPLVCPFICNHFFKGQIWMK